MTSPLPTVSVLVTVYDREPYLAGCLSSILASTWSDFEVIVVDDSSTDGSAAIAESYAEQDTRVRFFRNERNLGDYPNRMRAAELARGRYLKYVDSDDLIYPHSLAVMVGAMESHPNAALGISHSLPEDERPYPWELSPADAWRKEFLGGGCLGSGPSGAIMRRDAFIEAGGFHDWGVLSDTDLWYRLAAKAPVVLLPPGLVWWRRHSAQEFTKAGAAQEYFRAGFQITMQALRSPDSPLTVSERRRAEERARRRHARRLLSLAVRKHRPLAAWRLFRTARLSIDDLLSGLRKPA